VFFIVDNEDSTVDELKGIYGEEKVISFDKKKMADSVDEANNFDNRKVIVHARNYCFECAKKLGYEYFIQLDDDYYEFLYKFENSTGTPMPKDIDLIFDMVFDYYIESNATSLAFAQNGDFIGGVNNGKSSYRFSRRKCMNSFFCSTKRPFQFIGSINEDVNVYTTLASRGALFLTIPVLAINQKATQTCTGGMTDTYLKSGTYLKSFTTVMMMPSSVKVKVMNANHKRLHHSVNWKATVPCILSDKYKK
jgi:hypothetical protein